MPELADATGPPTVLFLGAGFSRVAGVPLAGELFREEPAVDRITRQRMVQAVRSGWLNWHERTAGSPEEYLAELEQYGGQVWRQAVWYASLVIALATSELRAVGFRRQVAVTKQNVDRTSIPAHEKFWTAVFTRTTALTVMTTNYDILAERGMRHERRPRVPRPGFNYGHGSQRLVGGGYPSFSHIRPIVAGGAIPLLKLHGSVSWAEERQALVPYRDCRPAIRGDPLIVAPVRGKHPPAVLAPIWDLARKAIAAANRVVVVGYSLPDYDDQVIALFRQSRPECVFHVFDPDPHISQRYGRFLDRLTEQHPGLPTGISDLGLLA